SGVSKPAIMRSVVVLPQPLGPSSEKNSPSAISSVTSFTAACPAKRLLTPDRAIATLASEPMREANPAHGALTRCLTNCREGAPRARGRRQPVPLPCPGRRSARGARARPVWVLALVVACGGAARRAAPRLSGRPAAAATGPARRLARQLARGGAAAGRR